MKKSEIKIGAVYSNGKGRERKVLDRGDYPMYGKQIDRDCILYEIVKDGSKKNRTASEQVRMSAASFCTWAKQEVSDGNK